MPADYFPERLDRAKHRHAQNPHPLLEWIVIDTTDHLIAGLHLLGFANDHLGGMPRAHQEQTFRGRIRPHAFRQHAGENAYPGQEHKGDQRLQHINGQRKSLQSPPIAHDEEERQRTSQNRFQDVHRIVDPGVAPPTVHEIEEGHDSQANHNEYGSNRPEQTRIPHPKLESQQPGAYQGAKDKADLRYQHQQRPAT